MTTKDLVPVEKNSAVDSYRMSTDAANMCREIVVQSSQSIQGKKYVKVEGWQAIAIAHGCTASSGDVERTETGYKAIGKVIRMSDGMVLSQAEGYVGEDEPVWFGGGYNYKTNKPYEKRPDYAIRAMAQTRAISRACRSAFAHVVVMMNAGLSTTPAEEVPLEGFTESHEQPPCEPSGQDTGSENTHTISEKQQKRLFAIAKSAGYSNEDLKQFILGCGYEHTKDIPSGKVYNDIIATLENTATKE